MPRATVEKDGLKAVDFQFVRHNAANETVLCGLADEQAELADIRDRSAAYGTVLVPNGDRVGVVLQ